VPLKDETLRPGTVYADPYGCGGGAPTNSDEAWTCKRHALRAQHAKMTEYRAWFHERRRPPRA
jgi:hypothetical protein